MLVLALVMIGLATFAVVLLPTSGQIGMWATALLVLFSAVAPMVGAALVTATGRSLAVAICIGILSLISLVGVYLVREAGLSAGVATCS